jgi:hypothetical protein
MTLIHAARPAGSSHPSASVPGEIGARLRLEGRQARLDDVLHAIVVNALGPDARRAVGRDEWAGLEEAIRGPVTDAASAALERLAVDLEIVLPGGMPDVVRRLSDQRQQRQRAELGYD